MTETLLVSGALANVHGIKNEELLHFLSQNLPDAEFYQLTGASAAAIDWRGIFRDTGAAASIAALLWMAYVEIVEPTKKEQESDAGIYVVLGNEESQQFWIGKDFRDRDIFVQTFSKEWQRITETENERKRIELEIEETRESKSWIRVE